MSVDQDVTADGGTADDDAPGGGIPAGGAPPVSRATVLGYTAGGLALVGWFLFGALVLRQGVVDSAGEALGTASALLLAVSVVGMVRASRR